MFLIGIVLMVFALGVYYFFIRELPAPPARLWRDVTSVEQLKNSLMEVILVVLSVMFLRETLCLGEAWTCESLALPMGVALFAHGIKLLGWQRH